VLLLGSEAISALANGPADRRERVRALVTEMRRRDLPIATAAAVLAEVVRGGRQDAAVFSGMRRDRVQVLPIDTRTGVRAGQLLGAADFDSQHAVDAFLVAVADLAGGAVIATVDTSDLSHLAASADRVSILSIQPEG
jgi:predicted nucleic acid-binding protein